jgi:vacuolar-type H+-ATPase catalytic subunit A/Vma1
LREFLIGQSAYDPADASSPVTKTWTLANTILRFHREGTAALAGGATMAAVDVAAVRRVLSAVRASPEGATP